MASVKDSCLINLVSEKNLGSAFKTPSTSFHIITYSAFKTFAKTAAVKSDPSLPNVVVKFSEVQPIKP